MMLILTLMLMLVQESTTNLLLANICFSNLLIAFLVKVNLLIIMMIIILFFGEGESLSCVVNLTIIALFQPISAIYVSYALSTGEWQVRR